MSATSKTSSTASAWLESLCQENIAFLQQSLPVVRPVRGRSRPVHSAAVLATTLQWGVGTLEAEIEEGSEVLHRMTQVLARLRDQSSRGISIAAQDLREHSPMVNSLLTRARIGSVCRGQ
jgi:hypothetical protein